MAHRRVYSFANQQRPGVRRLIPEAVESGFASSFDGAEIYWERHGPSLEESKEIPMLFCYGLVCSFNQWRYQIERYRKDRPVYVFDYRGHHKSSLPLKSQQMNLSALAKDAAAVIKSQENPRPFHVWGHSMGASVAVELAVAEPSLVHSLVLCCASVGNPFQHMFGSRILEYAFQPIFSFFPTHSSYFFSTWKFLLSNPQLAKIIVRLAGFNSDASTEEDIETYVQAVNVNPAKTFFPLLIEMSKGQTKNILSKVQTPVAIVAGSKDYITPIEEQRRLAESLENADFLEIPAGSHNVQLDFGEYVCMKVEESFKRRNLWFPEE